MFPELCIPVEFCNMFLFYLNLEHLYTPLYKHNCYGKSNTCLKEKNTKVFWKPVFRSKCHILHHFVEVLENHIYFLREKALNIEIVSSCWLVFIM